MPDIETTTETPTAQNAVIFRSEPCPECGKVFEANNQHLANRKLGTHRFAQHKVAGKTRVKNARYLANKEAKKFRLVSPEQAKNPSGASQLREQAKAKAAVPVYSRGVLAGQPMDMSPAAVKRRDYKKGQRERALARKNSGLARVLSMDPKKIKAREYQRNLYLRKKADRQAALANHVPEPRIMSAASPGEGAPQPNHFPISFCPHCGKDLRAIIAGANL